MRARGLLVYALLTSWAAVGCAGYTDVYHYRTALHSGQRTALPEVFLRGAPPPNAPFIEIAILQARSNDSFPAAVARLQQLAAQLGADALVDVRGESGSFETTVLGTAIVWSAPTTPQSQPGP